jgi:hypothetical protein
VIDSPLSILIIDKHLCRADARVRVELILFWG